MSGFAVSLPPAPQLSVIVPIYNGRVDLPDLLSCLQQQTYPADRVEFLLVDNQSTDGTAADLAEAGDRLSNLRVLSETQIQSAYAARNRGILAARGEILVFTDADCRPQSTWLQNLVVPFTQETVMLVAGEVTALPGRSLLEQYADRHETLSQRHTLAHRFLPYGQTANLAVRRSAFIQAGLFRPYLTTGGDADLCWRVQQQGGKIEFAETAIVQHRHRSTIQELRSQWQRYGRSNRYLHELHGVDLAKPLTWKDYRYRLSRWLVKEMPRSLLQVNICKENPQQYLAALLDTPLDLLCGQARSQGQQRACLPDAARQIPSFSAGAPACLTQGS